MIKPTPHWFPFNTIINTFPFQILVLWFKLHWVHIILFLCVMVLNCLLDHEELLRVWISKKIKYYFFVWEPSIANIFSDKPEFGLLECMPILYCSLWAVRVHWLSGWSYVSSLQRSTTAVISNIFSPVLWGSQNLSSTHVDYFKFSIIIPIKWKRIITT